MNICDIEKKFNIKILDKNIKFKTQVKFLCEIHNDIIQERRCDHLKDTGCIRCKREADNIRRFNIFKVNSNKKYNNFYEYGGGKYINNKTEIEITCPKHGNFLQRPDNHLSGAGCEYCNYKTHPDDLLIKLNKIYEIISFNITEHITENDIVNCTCEIHGNFKKSLKLLLMGHGCNQCGTISKSEEIISKYLTDNNFEYTTQKTFEDCKNIYKLRFDFHLPEYNILIEYDGLQHHKPVEYFGGVKGFKLSQKKDKIKNTFCLENNIKLIRISYKDNILNRLNEELY